MKPVEPIAKFTDCRCSCWKNFFWCVPKEKKGENGKDDNKDDGEGKKEKENGNGDRQAYDKQNGKDNGDEKKDEEKKEEPLTPLTQLIQCASPCCYERMKKRGDNVYGWAWMGFAANPAGPTDRIDFGTNFNWRANDYRLDQFYFVWENALEHEKQANVGYRVDFYTGHQAPFFVENGLFSGFTGFDETSGYGVEGPSSFRQLNRIGIDLPQFYLNAHIPYLITDRGVDVLVGKFWTLLGHELYPGPQTEFYSHSYEIIYGTAFTHTGILTTIHATDTWDVSLGIVRGWDVFEDNNQRPTYTGNFVWNSCDKRWNWTTAWTTGPEQFNNNGNYRTVVTSCVTGKLGGCNQWQVVFGGHIGNEANAAADSLTGNINDAEWHGLSSYLFYTVNPKLILGSRVEWFRDDDGTRTAVTKRPGFAANFYEVTLGTTYKPYQNLRLRPEIRFDWADGHAVDGSLAQPYNDLRDKFQFTAAIDLIWEF